MNGWNKSSYPGRNARDKGLTQVCKPLCYVKICFKTRFYGLQGFRAEAGNRPGTFQDHTAQGRVFSGTQSARRITMSVVKVIEVSAESPDSFEAAIKEGVRRAGKTVEGIKGAWVKEMQVTVENNKVKSYRVHLKLSFELKE